MPRYRFQIVTRDEASYASLETLPTVDAPSPEDAAKKLAAQGRLLIAGDNLILRQVDDDAEYLLLLAPDYELPLDWQPED